MGNCWSCLRRTIRNDRQYRYRPLRSSDESIQSLPEVRIDQPVPSTSTEHQPPLPQPLEGEVEKVRNRNESIQSIEEVPVYQPIPSTSSEREASTSQTPGGEVSVEKVRSTNDSIQSTEEVVGEQPLSPASFSSEPQPSTAEILEVGILEDGHIWNLAKRISNKEQLRDLALNILKIPEYMLDSALYNEREIQNAAHKVLKTWYQAQNNGQEAYRNLYTALFSNGWRLLAGELQHWVEGTTEPSPSSETQYRHLQKQVKDSLERNFKDFLKHDWLEEGLNFPLMQYYTDLVWTRMVKEAMGKKGETMKGMDEILEVEEAGRQGLNVLIQAKPGMGKSSSMAMLAMKWVKDKNQEFPFDFVFLIPLRNVDENCSLAELVADEHDLEKEDLPLLQNLLKGKTKHKVLLLLDGYDEYTPGTNTELDRAIEKTVGKCLLILTSRPKDQKDFTIKIRNKMAGEVEIRGFSEENIKKCCSKYLGSEEEADKFLKEAKTKAGLYELLNVPIILLISSVLYNENEEKSLPKRKTELYENLYEFIMDRSTLKPHNFGCVSSEVPNLQDMLHTLGRFAWEALQDDVRQLLINKEDLQRECPDIMKLGLLHEVGKKKATARKQPAFLSYEHKSLQEFGASKFVTKRLETAENIKETLKELFPSWEAVDRYREVVLFVAGLMKDSRPLVQHVYEMQVEDYLNWMRTGGLPSIDADLLKSLQAESSVRLVDDPLHNKYINYYDHDEDEKEKRPSDTIVYFPSTIYHFKNMKEDIVLGEYKEQRAEIPECAMYIYQPNETVTKSLLSTCWTISEHQEVTYLRMWYVHCHDATEAEAPILSRNIPSLFIGDCKLSTSFMKNMLQQLHDCVTLMRLELYDVDLREVEEDFDKLLDNLVSNHQKGLTQEKLTIWLWDNKLPNEFVTKWYKRCKGIASINYEICVTAAACGPECSGK